MLNIRQWVKITPFVVILVSAISIFSLQRKYSNQYLQKTDPDIDFALQEKNLKVNLALQRKLPSLGFDNILAGWQYLQYIQYLGDSEARKEVGYSAITDYFDLISNYDPLFLQANLILSATNSIYAGRPDKSVEFLERVIPYYSTEVNPDAFYLWIYKGTDEILFLGDIPSAINSYTMSAKWASERGDEIGDSIAQSNLQTVEFLKNNPASKKAQVMAWRSVLASALDDNTRKMVIDKIIELGAEVSISEDGRVRVKLPEED